MEMRNFSVVGLWCSFCFFMVVELVRVGGVKEDGCLEGVIVVDVGGDDGG